MNTLMNTDMNTTLEEMYFSFEEISDFVEEYSTDEEDAEYARLKEELDEGMLALESLLEYKGISRSMAVTFEQYIPAGYPLNSFSRLPSQTNYRPVVASLEEANWGIIGVIVVAIVAAITKLIMWFFDRKKKKDMKDIKKDYEKVIKEIGELSEKYDKDGKIREKLIGEYSKHWNQFLNVLFENKNQMLDETMGSIVVILSNFTSELAAFSGELKNAIKAIDRDSTEDTLKDNYIKLNNTVQAINAGYKATFKNTEKEPIKRFIAIQKEINEFIIELKGKKIDIAKGMFTSEGLQGMLNMSIVNFEERLVEYEKIDKEAERNLKTFAENLKEVGEKTNGLKTGAAEKTVKILNLITDYIKDLNDLRGGLTKYLATKEVILQGVEIIYKMSVSYKNHLEKAGKETSKP